MPLHRSQTVNSGFASRNGSQKAVTRIGDQTTIIKKGRPNASANADKFLRSGDAMPGKVTPTVLVKGPRQISVHGSLPSFTYGQQS